MIFRPSWAGAHAGSDLYERVCKAEAAEGLLVISAARPFCPAGVEGRQLILSLTNEEVAEWVIGICMGGFLSREDLRPLFLTVEPDVIHLSTPQWLHGALTPSLGGPALLESPLVLFVLDDVEDLPSAGGGAMSVADFANSAGISRVLESREGGGAEDADDTAATRAGAAGDEAAAAGPGGATGPPRSALERQVLTFCNFVQRKQKSTINVLTNDLAKSLGVTIATVKFVVDANPSSRPDQSLFPGGRCPQVHALFGRCGDRLRLSFFMTFLID